MLRCSLLIVLALVPPLPAQALAVVEEIDWPAFREQVEGLLAGLKKFDGALPADTTRAVQSLLAEKTPANPRAAGREVQKLLDAHCLVSVHINPESRVKATRGDRKAELVRDQPTYNLVKVHNEGGVTHPLAAVSEQAVVKKAEGDRWVEVQVLNDRPFAKGLSGDRVEYRVLKLTARQSGKREATLLFDVGQGTQDLGFRSEVPILFTIRAR